MKNEQTKLTWADCDSVVSDLANQIKSETAKYDSILGLSRGGLVFAVMLAHKLEINQVYSIGLRSYGSDREQKELEFYQELPISALNKLKTQKFLVVDDVVENQTSLEFVKNYLGFQSLEDNYEIACAYSKGSKPEWIKYIGKELLKSSWIVFPYEIG